MLYGINNRVLCHNIHALCLHFRAIVFASFWAETTLHNGITRQILNVGNFIGNFTEDSDTTTTIDTIVIAVEDKRYGAATLYTLNYCRVMET